MKGHGARVFVFRGFMKLTSWPLSAVISFFPTLTEEKQPTSEGWISSTVYYPGGPSKPPPHASGCSELDILGLWAGIRRLAFIDIPDVRQILDVIECHGSNDFHT